MPRSKAKKPVSAPDKSAIKNVREKSSLVLSSDMSPSEFLEAIRHHEFLNKSILMVVLSVVVVISVVLPIWGKFKLFKSKLVRSEKRLSELSNEVIVLDSLDGQVLGARVDLVNSVLPPEKDAILYLFALDGLARDLSLSLGDISLAPGSSVNSKKLSSDLIDSITTTIKISGSKDNLYKFLKTVETVAPLMEIKDVKMSKTGEDVFTLNVKLGMFYAISPKIKITKDTNIDMLGEDEDLLNKISSFRNYSNNRILNDSVSPQIQNGGRDDLFSSKVIRLKDQLESRPQTSPQKESSDSGKKAL